MMIRRIVSGLFPRPGLLALGLAQINRKALS